MDVISYFYCTCNSSGAQLMAQPGVVADVLSTASCDIILELSPPDYVVNVSRYLESYEGQDQHKVSNEPAADGR